MQVPCMRLTVSICVRHVRRGDAATARRRHRLTNEALRPSSCFPVKCEFYQRCGARLDSAFSDDFVAMSVFSGNSNAAGPGYRSNPHHCARIRGEVYQQRNLGLITGPRRGTNQTINHGARRRLSGPRCLRSVDHLTASRIRSVPGRPQPR